jgi:anti-sigma factor ChrR (cupin superfamily)
MRSERAKQGVHDRYERLIALYSTGELTDAEMRELTAHLRVCGSCREDLGEYRTIFRYVGAAAPSRENTLPESDDCWAPELKKKVLNNFVSMRGRRLQLRIERATTGNQQVPDSSPRRS